MIAHSPVSATTVRVQVVTRTSQTPRPGTPVPSGEVGVRTFLDARFGVALGGVDSTTYPLQTTDGGRVWRINGPALYTDAADAPLAVSALSAMTRRVQFTTGNAGGNVVDLTTNGGRTWRRATFQGVPVAVLPAASGGGLVAYVQSEGDLNRVTTAQFVSRDGGRTWRISTVLGGGR